MPASFIGQSLREIDLRVSFGITVLAIKRGDEVIVSPPADHRFAAGELLVAIGTNAQIARLSEFN